jgi:Ni/Fe-hydrogenase 1 B-type cytochrome subunit
LEVISRSHVTLPTIFHILTGSRSTRRVAGRIRGGQRRSVGTPFFGDSQALHTWHHVAMWVLIIYVIIHVYLVIRQDVLSRQSYISTMISGMRMFKD